jgi:hypothetical protein
LELHFCVFLIAFLDLVSKLLQLECQLAQYFLLFGCWFVNTFCLNATDSVTSLSYLGTTTPSTNSTSLLSSHNASPATTDTNLGKDVSACTCTYYILIHIHICPKCTKTCQCTHYYFGWIHTPLSKSHAVSLPGHHLLIEKFSLVTQQVPKPTEAESAATRCPACRASAPPAKVMFLPLVPPTTTPGCSDTCLASGLPQCMLSLRSPLTAPPSAPPLPAAPRTALAAHCPSMRLTAVCPGPRNTYGTM